MLHNFSLDRFRSRLKLCSRDSGGARLRQTKSSAGKSICRALRRAAVKFAFRCGHQVRRAFALMAATVSPEYRRNAGELE
ncbi:hypothetical protein EFB14_29490 [Rhizobium fabae]|uniref:Uncharacterized protein n=1 Tax=Rhizobium fabae TaxID=573179 RepID=A0ABY0B1J5_9HYPH|nr:hypothetical protein EFB14_29490 [Rhizobium fabae]